MSHGLGVLVGVVHLSHLFPGIGEELELSELEQFLEQSLNVIEGCCMVPEQSIIYLKICIEYLVKDL